MGDPCGPISRQGPPQSPNFVRRGNNSLDITPNLKKLKGNSARTYTTTMLCQRCASFPISSLYAQALHTSETTQPTIPLHGIFAEYSSIPEFYPHHIGITSLKTSAEKEGCELCNLIYTSFTSSLKLPAGILEQEWLSPDADKGKEQIYLGLSKWAPDSYGLPYLTAIQKYGKRGEFERNLAIFEVFAPHGEVPVGYEKLLAREVYQDPTDEECLAVARVWSEGCLNGHDLCRKVFKDDRELPTRVLYVGAGKSDLQGNDLIPLVVTNGMKGSWAALSYCWGGDSTFILKKDRLEVMRNGISLADFPKTLRDAVMVTRNLGIRYIWIDAICIIQDSESDWAAEAAKMQDVYRGAKITISAISSPGTGYGMLRERETSGPICELDWKDTDGTSSKVYLRSGSALWDINMKSSALNTRGWTLQEALLSPRVLAYGSQQMIWECMEQSIDEGGRPVAPGQKYRDKKFMQELLATTASVTPVKEKSALQRFNSLSIFGNSLTKQSQFEEPYDRWFLMVTEYKSRHLTDGTDMLPALSGLAGAFQNILNDSYHAGLWEKDMLRGLMWMLERLPDDERERMAARSRPKDYLIPSWSWASIYGRTIAFMYPPTNEYIKVLETAKILEVSTTPRLQDPFGQTSGGYMIIQGLYHSISDPSGLSDPCCPVLEEVIRDNIRNVRSYVNEWNQQHRPHEDQDFGVLLLTRSEEERRREIGGKKTKYAKFPTVVMLIVESTGEVVEVTGKKDTEFRRVGLLMMRVDGSAGDDQSGGEFFDEMKKKKWTKRTLKIV